MEYSKCIIILCLFSDLTKQNYLDPKEITEKYNINNRRMWSYIKNIKEYLEVFTNQTLVYSITDKKYYLK